MIMKLKCSICDSEKFIVDVTTNFDSALIMCWHNHPIEMLERDENIKSEIYFVGDRAKLLGSKYN